MVPAKNTTATTDCEAPIVKRAYGNAELCEPVAHNLRIVRVKQPGQRRVAPSQRGQQQSAVRDAFGTGQAKSSVGSGTALEINELHGSYFRYEWTLRFTRNLL